MCEPIIWINLCHADQCLGNNLFNGRFVTVRVLFQLTLKGEYNKQHKIYKYYSINMLNIKTNIQNIVQNYFFSSKNEFLLTKKG